MYKFICIIVTIISGLSVLIDYFVDDPLIDLVGSRLVEGATILAGFALLLGILNLLHIHARRVLSDGHRRFHSGALIVALLGTMALGIARPSSSGIRWVFEYLYLPLQASLASLLAFFALSAAYRVFKLRTIEAAILLAVGLFMFLAQLPFSAALSPYLPLVREWILAVPVTAGMRGIILGTALGIMATSLRVLLAVDRPYAGQ